MRARAIVALLMSLALVVAACGDDGGALVTTTAAPTTTTTPATTTTRAATTTSTAASTSTLGTTYPQAAIDYFLEIGFGPEFGGGAEVIRKWTQDVRIVVHGDPNPDDLATLERVVADLNELIDTIEVLIVDSNGNVDIHFAPVDEFDEIVPSYVPGNLGYFAVWWDGDSNITRSTVLITTTGVTQEERNHLIREEVTQQMGIMSDSFTYEDSMFYQGWTTTQELSAIDALLIEMLYLPRIEVGMSVAEFLAAIAG